MMDVPVFQEIEKKYFTNVIWVFHENNFLAEGKIVCNKQEHYSFEKII